MTSTPQHRKEVTTIPNINGPPDVRLERERVNEAIALRGWGPTLRLKLLRTPVAPGALILGAIGVLTHIDISQALQIFN
jgi:hypothetical protein